MIEPQNTVLLAVASDAVSGFPEYLPLSHRPPVDESGVSNNWSSHTGAVLTTLAGILGNLSEAQWASISVRPGSTEAVDIRRIVAELLWDLEAKGSRVIAVGQLAISKGLLPHRARTIAIGRIAERKPTTLTEEISRRATAGANPHATGSVHQLGQCVAALLEISEVTAQPVTVDPVVCGAVAIAATLSAPLAIRAVLARSELRARAESAEKAESAPLVDQGGSTADRSWSVGRGRRTTATAAAIVLFVYGRRGFPAPAGG
jgi:hypothetical protein